MNELGKGRYRAFSAGSRPAGQVNPLALEKLRAEGHSTDGLSSKSWDVFAGPAAPPLDIVITVCDSAAGESCPLWSGSPLKLHWSIPDPAAATGKEESRKAFDLAYSSLRSRVERFLADTEA